MRDADNAMQRSRSSAESTITVFQSAMHQQVMRDLQLESQLRAALREAQLVAHFQPIVDLEHRPDHRLRSPGPLAPGQHPADRP
jgi:predicted signal transduction protein with EAL and GGDEF domain